MRFLIGWGDTNEAETLKLMLNVESNSAEVITDGKVFQKKAQRETWDAILLDLSFPDNAAATVIYQELASNANTPIVGAWKEGQVNHLARFISNGLNSHIMRDANGDFIFLLTTLLEAARAGALAQQARLLAERLREEVDSVRRLQESVIPQDLPAHGSYTVSARYEPSQIRVIGELPVVMAGGDYYDVFSLNERQMILLVGDASGHGVKACMSIMTMHTLIRMIRGQKYPDTAKFVAEVNRRLCANDIVQDEGGFITLLYSMLNVDTNTFQWTCAGQPMPLLQNLETNEVRAMGDDDDGGLPLAIDDDWDYELCSYEIPNNSRVLIYTDGLDEAFPADADATEAQHMQFGIEGIVNTLRETVNAPLEEAVDRLFVDSNAATKGTGRHDDTSVVLFQRRD